MNIVGTIHSRKEIQVISDKFSKREFVVRTEENPEHPQFILFQLVNDRCNLVDGFRKGDMIDVSFNLRGREWTSPQGEVKVFNTLDAWRITPVGDSQTSSPAPAQTQVQHHKPNPAFAGASAAVAGISSDADDLPF